MAKYDVFISYSRRDFRQFNDLVNRLKSEIPSLRIWYDIDGIESAADFQEKIINAIDESKIVIFVCSENSMDSQYYRKEIMYAKNTEKTVIPYLLSDMKLKGWLLFEFGNINCVDSTKQGQVTRMINDLKMWCVPSEKHENKNELTSEIIGQASYVVDTEDNHPIGEDEEEEGIADVDKPFFMRIEDVFSITNRGLVVVGRIQTGKVRVGDQVLIKGNGATHKTTITGVEMFRKLLDQAETGDNVGLLIRGLNKNIVKAGMTMCHQDHY